MQWRHIEMRRTDAGSVVRQRMLRLKKRKTVLRRQSRLREMMLLAKHGHQDGSPDTTEPSADTE
jgi:hypothetical protein